MNARSALFDLYGDHLRARGGEAPVAALVRILASLDITAPAVRTAISRMVRQGWLSPVTVEEGPGYRMTPAAERRLSQAAERIYRTTRREWDGRWHVLVLGPVPDRARRDRIANALSYLGYGRLAPMTWISAQRSDEARHVLAGEAVEAHEFEAQELGAPADIAAAAWDLAALAHSYVRWQADAAELIDDHVGVDDQDAFVTRSLLVHGWRKFLFSDPGLPTALLPDAWPGKTAADFFDEQANALRPGAERYVEQQLERRGEP